MIFLFGSPYHPNMGDQAQTYCIQKWYRSNFPEYDMCIFQLPISSKFILKMVRKYIRKEDMLVCHSGYHLTDLYQEQRVYFSIIKDFRDFPIVIFPQTINYSTDDTLEEAIEVLNSHPNLTIMCRDEQSYVTAERYFSHARIMLYPDVVTSLIGTKKYDAERDGVLFCMRNDKEAYYKPEQIEMLRKRFSEYKTWLTDTTRTDFPMKYIYQHREEALDRVLEEISHYKIVITDRYHGTIFSLITGTPVVVLGTTDHKLKSGVNWFPKEIFGDYVFFANDLDEAYDLAMNVLNHYEKIDHQLPAYFKERYYDVLKKKIYGEK